MSKTGKKNTNLVKMPKGNGEELELMQQISENQLNLRERNIEMKVSSLPEKGEK